MRASWIAIVLALTAASCGNKTATCVEGASVACACPGGGSGAQVCSNNAYGACACAPAAAPLTPTVPAAPTAPSTDSTPAAQPAPPPPPVVDAAVPAGESDHDRAVREAKDKVDQIFHEIQRVDHDTIEAQRAVNDAKTQAERDAATARLKKLNDDMVALQKRSDDAKRELDRAEHRR